MTALFGPISGAVLIFSFVLITFLNNPYRIHFAQKTINEAVKAQRKQERLQKKSEKQKEKSEINE
ncbi:hypothetical protein [Furfurilactobacillus rossiae]|uniref:Uncharacterized protein n=1 Tax=Furfurilactobacillus rossiae DSM 15814 TaxID=1114972 RepID=A0A0R1RGV5_9LACO|nr:hypothetical protein [Furfurilactobacillus rossiae]KRL52899.1 hypothetical protein FD35_GL001795 [Furfurilactobacillus rossiae DSM 15814]QFR65614.1 hypothetical protein LR814_00100 [Furfurilactobacillus rossiae]QFR68008.1 hypothetical protein LR814_13290 [Furfurilactobacillus rossiae]QLE61002.1 hypothetical protein LROSRS0_0955 [Furfurilactobacillus rossiae]